MYERLTSRLTGNLPFRSSPSTRDMRVRENMTRGYAHVATNLAVVAGATSLVSCVVPPLVGGALTAALAVSSIAQIAASLCIHRSNQPSSAKASFVMHAAMGVGIGLIAPLLPPYALATAAITTAVIAGSLLISAAFVSPKGFEGMEGPLLAGLIGCLCLSVTELLLPPHLGMFGTLGLVNTALGVAVGAGLIVFDSSRMAQQAQQDPEQFDAVGAAAAISSSVVYLFHQILKAVLQNEARKHQRA